MITADDIINGVNRRISNPQPQGLLSNSDILSFCDNIIQAQLIPLLESVDQDYFVDRIEIPLVAGQSNYSVPYRSVARGLREIRYKESPTTVNLRKHAVNKHRKCLHVHILAIDHWLSFRK